MAIVDIPLMSFLFLSSQGPTFFYVIKGVILLLIDGLIMSLSFLGKRMSYKLGEDNNWNPNRWAHKSELFIIASVAAIFSVINTILALKFGRYGKELIIFLGVVFILVIALFFGIVYLTQSVI